MYRGGEQVNPGRMNFYTFDDPPSHSSHNLRTPPYSAPHGHFSNTPDARGSYSLDAADISKKMMTLLTSTQQMVLVQQATTHRLEENVKLSQNVSEMQQYVTSIEAAENLSLLVKPLAKRLLCLRNLV